MNTAHTVSDLKPYRVCSADKTNGGTELLTLKS